MKVPFVDLGAQYSAHRAEFDAAIASVIAETAFIGGRFVRDFEKGYSAAYSVKNCVSCANGTDAIYVVLRQLGIGAGDEVITTAASWISTSETITQAGATPVFVDVDEFGLIDCDAIEGAVTARTRAIIPVHLYGQSCDMDSVLEIARRRNLYVVEDCAQAHFAEWRGRRVGTFGVAATFSFYPGKNLGAWGDAGAIITDDDDLARRCRMYANHGALVKHEHAIEGINSRLDGLQASLLLAKLPHVAGWTNARRRVANEYGRLLAGVGDLELPSVRPGATHVYHLYVIKTSSRDQLRAYLAERGIETAIHYPTALPLLPAYARFGFTEGDFPRASANQRQILSLPIFPEITDAQIEYVADAVKDFFR